MTQLARWGITAFPKNWVEVLERINRLDLYWEATRQLGLPQIEPNRHPFALFDGVTFDPDEPLDYLHRLPIHREIQVVEIPLDALAAA
jgi:nitrate/nitrite transport system ATP-binding protein